MNDAATMSLGAETVFVDTNIFMYLAGDDPARRIRCRSALHAAVERRVTLTTSAEVLQEILHRYFSINRPDSARTVYRAAVDICAEILPITERQTARALDLLAHHPRLSARDAVHVATMEDRGIRRILSTDRDFDALDLVERIDPLAIDGH